METQNHGTVKHPGREEWMGWLYGEVSAEEKTRLTAHLESCGACRAEVDRWRGVMRTLDEYELPLRRRAARLPQPVFKWAAAAAVVLAVGFGAGRLVPSAPGAAFRASLKSELRAELLAELQQQQQQALAEQAKATADAQNAANKVIFEAIAKVDADRTADYAALRKDLETMAVLTQDGFQKAQQQIVNLAALTEPGINEPNQ